MRELSIVIPAANSRPVCERMLRELLQSIIAGQYPAEVIVAFDGCDKRFVNTFIKEFPEIHAVISKGKSVGFARNANRGIRQALKLLPDKHVVILNMDTIVPHWEHFKHVLRSGLSSPTQVHIKLETEDLDKAISDLNNIAERNKGAAVQEVPKFAGFCMVLSPELLQKVGILDEVFIASFEDDDLCVRAALAGFPVEATAIPVHHYIHNRTETSTTGAYNLERLQLSMLSFRLKWNIPMGVNHDQFNSFVRENHEWSEEMKEV